MVVGVGAGRLACQPATPANAPGLARQQADSRRLDQENAQLTAEAQQLRQTLIQLKSQPVAPVPTNDQPYRIPSRRAEAEPATMIEAARWLGATIEVNPHGAESVQALTTGGPVNPPLVLAAAEGLAQPAPVVAAAGKTDFAVRVRLLDTLRQAVEDPAMDAQLAKLREALLARWTEAGGSQPGD